MSIIIIESCVYTRSTFCRRSVSESHKGYKNWSCSKARTRCKSGSQVGATIRTRSCSLGRGCLDGSCSSSGERMV
jgi:hypothetical protein